MGEDSEVLPGKVEELGSLHLQRRKLRRLILRQPLIQNSTYSTTES